MNDGISNGISIRISVSINISIEMSSTIDDNNQNQCCVSISTNIGITFIVSTYGIINIAC